MTILGTGTSQGVPVIGCTCPVCQSKDPRDRRLRTAAHIETEALSLAIDCGPDFRQQMLRAGIRKLDGILLTHEHNDHIIGLDDVRPFNFMTWSSLDVYATPAVQHILRQRFDYIFTADPYPGAPRIHLRDLDAGRPLRLSDLEIQPVQLLHGQLPVLGFRMGDFAYLTDIKTISEAELEKVKGVENLVISALHHEMHHSHLNLQEALALIERIGPQRAWLTHISHRMGLYREVDPRLPAGIHLAYDGLVLDLK